MKKISITPVSKEEKKSIAIIKKHYGIKTAAGAARKAIIITATAITINKSEKWKK